MRRENFENRIFFDNEDRIGVVGSIRGTIIVYLIRYPIPGEKK